MHYPCQGYCVPLNNFAALGLQFVVLEFAAHSLPEVADLLGDAVAAGPHGAGAFLGEELADVDAENFLVFADGALVVDQDQRFPAQVIAQVQDAEGRFQLIEDAGKAGKRLALDLVELGNALLAEGGKGVQVLLNLGGAQGHVDGLLLAKG